MQEDECGVCGNHGNFNETDDTVWYKFSNTQPLEIHILQNQNFAGYAIFRICDITTGSPLTNKCLNEHVLEVMSSDVMGDGMQFWKRYVLEPPHRTSSHYVLQWSQYIYEGNSHDTDLLTLYITMATV